MLDIGGKKLDRMLKMLVLNAIIALYCTNTETFLHQYARTFPNAAQR